MFHTHLATCRRSCMLTRSKFTNRTSWMALSASVVSCFCAAGSQHLPRPHRRSHFLRGQRRSEWHPEQVRHTLSSPCVPSNCQVAKTAGSSGLWKVNERHVTEIQKTGLTVFMKNKACACYYNLYMCYNVHTDIIFRLFLLVLCGCIVWTCWSILILIAVQVKSVIACGKEVWKAEQFLPS